MGKIPQEHFWTDTEVQLGKHKKVKLHRTNNIARLTVAKYLDLLLFHNNIIFFLNLVYCFFEFKIQAQSIQVQPENGTTGRKITNVIVLVLERLQQLRKWTEIRSSILNILHESRSEPILKFKTHCFFLDPRLYFETSHPNKSRVIHVMYIYFKAIKKSELKNIGSTCFWWGFKGLSI